MCQLYINTSAASAISLSLYYNRDIIQIYFINEFRKTDFMGNIPPHWLQDCWQWLVIQELVSHSPLFAQILQYLCSSRHRPFSVDKVPTLDFYILNFMLNISWCAWNIKYVFIPKGDSVVGVTTGEMVDKVEFVSHLYNRFNFKMSDYYRKSESELTIK